MADIEKEKLIALYQGEKLSVAEIAPKLRCSAHKVNYWIKKYGIQKRSISEAMYRRYNPDGDPFSFAKPQSIEDAILYGLGVGLYWGEGNKANTHSVRLGNTDPRLLEKFIEFLEKIYCIKKSKLRFGLQVFDDMSPELTRRFWEKALKISYGKFNKIIVTPTRSLGTYRNKTKHGVLSVYFHNKKLRDILCQAIESI